MFDSSLLAILQGDSTLTNLLSTYTTTTGEKAAIFSNSASEVAEFPYLVFDISSTSSEDSVVETFNVMINIFDYNTSGIDGKLAARRVIELLDLQQLTHAYYDTIRFRIAGQDSFESTDDPKAKHQNIRFTVRAGRSGWAINTL